MMTDIIAFNISCLLIFTFVDFQVDLMRVPRMSLLSITNLILFLCGCLSNALNTGYKSYKGYAILTVQPGSQKDMEILRKLDSMFEEPMDYLKEPHGLRDNGQILVSPENLPLVKVFLNDHRIPFTTKPIHIGPARHRRALRPTDPYQLSEIVTSYLSYDDQMQYLDKTAAAFPYTTQIKNIGTSTEGRAIKIIKIGFPSPTNQQKPIIWIDAGIHAREWISYSVALFFIQQLTQNQKYSSVIKLIDFVIAPNVNPDGYEYSRTKDRFWRKTRSKHGDNRCYGSDGNRNYPFHFGEEGVTWNSCSEVYPGPYERSEPEVAALVREIMAYRQDIKAYVSLHSYGQEILYPWGHRTGAYPPDVNDLKAVANKMAEAIQRFDGTVYNVLNSGDGLCGS
ncbi:hypothetical protein WR25_25812 isoform A, partial [Diploscapter pachys]